MPKLVLGLYFLSALCSASPSWVKPVKHLNAQEKLNFWTGFSLFRSPWVAAPASTKGRDGLGPLYNARSCDACHHNGAHGKLPNAGFGLVVRLGLTNRAAALPSYGEQLQTLSIDSVTHANSVAPEAQIELQWQQVTLSIGQQRFKLKTPILKKSQLGYGPWPTNSAVSLRLAPALFGLGDIERVSSAEILRGADPEDTDGNGISGKANKVLNRESGQLEVGRFGYKAEQPNLRQQVAAAFHQDIGITSWLYPKQNCTASQTACLNADTGNSTQEQVEITREKLQLVAQFNAFLRPAYSSKPASPAGEQLFNTVGCQLCHSAFSQINVYSNLLLHDLGAELGDHRPVSLATGQEWRTSPLRGIARKLKRQPVRLLHDGRAGSVEDAILWHGGEASETRANFLALADQQKHALIQFISSL
ncbi:MAG: hypothetical protein KTR17_06065 [Cellvibrionaceae bacterium]|nr:hypothetical protein [Cellvibrionaceae bacterium]